MTPKLQLLCTSLRGVHVLSTAGEYVQTSGGACVALAEGVRSPARALTSLNWKVRGGYQGNLKMLPC